MQLKDIIISKQNVRDTEDTSDEFENLKDSIKKDSLIQRIVLRPSKQEGMYEVIAGGRRYRALLSLYGDDYVIQDNEYKLYSDMNDDRATLWSIEENTQRLEFSPMALNRAGLILNRAGLSDKEIAKKLNVSQVRLKKILNLSAGLNRMPDVAKEQLNKISEEAVFTEGHWSEISKKTDDEEIIKDVVDYIIDKEVPVKEVQSIIKMVEKNHAAQEGPSSDPEKNNTPQEQAPDDPFEYSHKGELVLELKGGVETLKVIGKGEDSEVPVELYLNYLRHPEKFKCYVTFKLKIKNIE